MELNSKKDYRKRRHYRIRKKIKGTPERPRMSVFISHQHMYIQFIDDTSEQTVASMSTQHSDFKSQGGRNNREGAEVLGRLAAQAAKDKGIEQVVFDRGGFSFRGRVKVIADTARGAGLKL